MIETIILENLLRFFGFWTIAQHYNHFIVLILTWHRVAILIKNVRYINLKQKENNGNEKVKHEMVKQWILFLYSNIVFLFKNMIC